MMLPKLNNIISSFITRFTEDYTYKLRIVLTVLTIDLFVGTFDSLHLLPFSDIIISIMCGVNIGFIALIIGSNIYTKHKREQ